jgi:hypothetical protein
MSSFRFIYEGGDFEDEGNSPFPSKTIDRGNIMSSLMTRHGKPFCGSSASSWSIPALRVSVSV